MRKAIFGLLLVVIAAYGFSQVLGGGEHKIISIKIMAKTQDGGDKDPTTLRVGKRLPLQVVAAWKIPYVGNVTDKAKISVNNPRLVVVDKQGVLTALRPGKVVVEAVLRVADHGNKHEVLAPEEAAGAYPVITFTDRMELTIVK